MLRSTLHTGYQCYLHASLPPTSTQERRWNSRKKSMSDNIRKKGHFWNQNCKNCSKSTKIWHFANLILTLQNEKCFTHTTTNSGVSIFYSYRDLAWTKHKLKKCFFWPKLPKFLAKLNFNFWLQNFSRYVIFGIFCQFFARKVLGDMARTRKALQTDGRTDGRTDIHGGKNNICLPQGETYNTILPFALNQSYVLILSDI